MSKEQRRVTAQLVLGYPRHSPAYHTGTGNFINAIFYDFIIVANPFPVCANQIQGNMADLARILCRQLLLLGGATTVSMKVVE